MRQKYLICYTGGEGRLVEKKSEFIAEVFPVRTEEEALQHLEDVRKKYWDASHHCYAFSLAEGSGIQKFSDDGEPSQTAGKPMMDILENEGIHDVLAVVTRYFGGTLLGTGGLVRAYQGALKEALKSCELLERHEGSLIVYSLDYDVYGRLQRLVDASSEYAHLVTAAFSDKVTVKLAVDKSFTMNIIDKVNEISTGKAEMLDNTDIYFLIRDGKVLIL